MSYKRILIVDDDEEMLQLLEKKLSSSGYGVIKVTSGKEAFKKAKDYKPDLILMDIVLPDIDGAEAVTLLQSDAQTAIIPVIFLSGIVTQNDASGKNSVTVSGREYVALGKPFTAKDLMDKVSAAFK